MIEPSPVVTFALISLVAALGVALVALWRAHRRLGARIGCMVDAMPARQPRDTETQIGVQRDMDRLEEAFDEMTARLQVQRATLDQAFRIAGLGTWTILPDLGSVRASPHIRMILGFSKDDEIVQLDALRDRIVQEDRATFTAALDRAANQRLATDIEFRAVDTEGDIRIFRARTGPGGAVPHAPEHGISGIIQDITDLRQTEAELARSNTLERLAGEAARIGGWRYEIASRMFTATPQKARIVGLKDECHALIDDTMDRLVPGEDRTRMERSFWTCVGTGERFDEIAKFRTYDDDEIWLRVIGEAERDASGKIIATYGASQDVSELINARSAADDVRALLQTSLDDLSDGFVIFDHDGVIQYINRRAHSILGVADLDLIGGNIWRDLPLEADSPFQALIADALEAGESRHLEGEIATPDQWVNVMVHPTDAGIAIYLNDVTEEREARTRLRLLDAAMRQVNDVVLITDASTLEEPGPCVVFVNEAFVSMTGYSQKDILGATPRILQGPETEQEGLDEIRRALKTDQPVRTELTNYRKDGSRFTAEVDINPLFDATGTCTHYVSVQRDTTERRRNEELLRAREERLRLASRASNDIIWDWDMRTGTIWNSENCEIIFGSISRSYGGTSGAGRTGHEEDSHLENIPKGRIENVLERIHPDDRLKITESLDAALSSQAQTWRCEYRVGTKDGGWKNISDKAFIVRDEDGAPRRMVGAMTDMTEFRELDAQLHQAQKLETVGQLTGGIAHDFNNLITIILGNCDILLDDLEEGSSLRPLLQSIDDAAERAAQVSSDLLAFSRLQPLDLRPTDVNELIRRSSALFKRAVDASVDIRYDLTEAPAVARVDSNKLQTALLNLVINARDAIEETGCITVTTRAEVIGKAPLDHDLAPGDYVLIDISDDGAGMSPDVARQAFEPFFTTKEPGVGTGLGLSSVYGFVKQCGGHARIVSEPGNGTTVTLSLPVADGAVRDLPVETVKETNGQGGERILVVEDDAELRTMVRTALSRIGFRIVEAENGQVALDILEKDGGFDLLFTDIVMPGEVNGVQVAQAAQDIYPDLRVLFTSGYAREALPKERHVPGDVPMLGKPYRTNDLIKSVRETLAKEPPRQL